MDDEALIALAAAVADGTPVDWAAIESGAHSVEQKELINRLRLVADVAAIHRSGPLASAAAPTPATEPNRPPPSLKNGQYTVERALGKGGYGVVYQAFQADAKMHVALKSLTRADVGGVYDLKREFRTLADLSHPNLVSLYELFAEDGQWFIAMELVNGVEFLEYVRGGTPPEAGGQGGVACDLTRLEPALWQLAEALCYLHAHGKLHRDIKPSNVLVTSIGHLKVLDFGLSGDVAPERDATLLVRGTPAYVSPEQANGGVATEASDWYSVGVMLFEALTGQRPFTGTYLDVLAAKQRGDAPDPAAVCPAAPEALNGLCRDLLRRDPAARPLDAELVARLQAMRSSDSPAAPRRVGRSARQSFVGRVAQLATLNRAFELSLLGHTQTVCVHGGSGIGKTALVGRFLKQLRDREPDVVVLEGRCYERESVPYKALDHLVDGLSRYLNALPYAEADALMPRDVGALTRLFPILRRVEVVAQARYRVPPAGNAQELRRRGFAAFRELIERLSDRHSVVMVIDDLQWGDEDSAALLVDLLRTVDPPAVLFIACYRYEEMFSSPAATTLFFTDAADVHQVPLEELSDAEAYEVASALSRIYGGTLPLEAIVRESGGSPFLIDELVQYSASAASSELPAPAADGDLEARRDLTVESVIRARTGLLSDSARRLLEAVAVFGGPVPVSLATEAAQLTRGGIEEITALRAAHLTRMRKTGEERIEIYHDRIREAITGQIVPDERQRLHARIADVLERSGQADPETLLLHFSEAGNPETAAHYAVIAADRACDALAFDRAAQQYRLALAMGRFPAAKAREIRIKLGDALAAGGRGYDAAQAYLAAAEGARAAELLELKRRTAEQLLRSGHIDEGMKAMRAVLDALGMKLAETPARALLSLLLRRAWIRIRGLRFRERDRSQLSAEALVRVDACWSIATAVGVVDTIAGADFQARHLLLALEAGDPHRIARALAVETTYAALAGPRMLPRQQKLSAMAQQLAEQVGDPISRALVTLANGTAWFFQGRWRTAHDYLEQAEALLRECSSGNAWELDTTCLYHVLTLFYLGDIKALSARLPTFLKEARERDDLTAATNLRTRTSYIMYLAADDPARARDEVRQGMALCAPDAFHAQHSWELYARGEIDLYEGNGDGAWTWVTRRWRPLKRSLLMRIQAVRVESLYLRARSALAAASDPALTERTRADLIRHARRDARSLAREDAAWAQALALLVRSGVAAACGERAQAVTLLSGAESEFTLLDMRLHATVARRRRGEITGGAAGAALVDDANAWMAREAIVNPARMTDMLAPGARRPIA